MKMMSPTVRDMVMGLSLHSSTTATTAGKADVLKAQSISVAVSRSRL